MSDLGSRASHRVRATLDNILGPRGRMAARCRHFVPHPRQLEMAGAVAGALAAPHHLVVEAPAAIDPALAYLVPAVLASGRPSARIVISAATDTRRRQLLEEDIPLLRAVMPEEFTAVRVQGRHNYLGLRRLGLAMRKRALLFGDRGRQRALRRLTRWASRTSGGTLDDLPDAADLALWDRVKSEHGNCMGHRCPDYRTCFYQTDRRRAEHAQLLIVDHELLLADMIVRRRGGNLIPEFDYVIIDEADRLPAAARGRLGLTLSNDHIDHLLDALFDDTGCGFLAGCHAQSAIGAVDAARRARTALFDELIRWYHTMLDSDYSCPLPVNNGLSPALRHLHEQLARVRSLLLDENDLFEMTSLMDRCTTLADVLEELLGVERDNCTYHLNVDDAARVTLRAYPANEAAEMADGLFNSIGAVILTAERLADRPDDPALAGFCTAVGLDDAHVLRIPAC